MTAATRILTKVFNCLNGGAVCAYVDDDKQVTTVATAKDFNEYVVLVGNLVYLAARSTGLTTRQVLDDVTRAAFLLESEEPKIETEAKK